MLLVNGFRDTCINIAASYPPGSGSTCPIISHSLLLSRNNSYSVVIKTQHMKELFGVCGLYKKYYLELIKG